MCGYWGIRHPYIELREEGKKLIFFCTMCLAPCYGDSCLFDHLNGNLHSERLAAAQDTLFKPNPWPFNDGVFFFHSDSDEKIKSLPASDREQNKVLDIHHADKGCDIGPAPNAQSEDTADCIEDPCDSTLNDDGTGRLLVIPAVLQKDEISDLVVRKIGVGKIGARFSEKDGCSSEFRRIWCELLGNEDITNEDVHAIPEHEFAIVTFSYNYNLGRMGFRDGFRYLLPSSSCSEAEDSSSSRGKKRKSFSDPEDGSETVANHDDSYGEEFQSSNNSKSKLVFSGNDDQPIYSRILSSKTMRKKLRKQQCVASERTCDLCKQKLFPNKDVAALLNRTTGKLSCSSRNFTGAFHIFHISCLIQWVLLGESEIFAKRQFMESKGKSKSRRKTKGKNMRKQKMQCNQTCSTYCPECQGNGIIIDGDDLEKPTVSLSEIFWRKIKLCDARKAWMKSPESLESSSIGFYFPSKSDEIHQANHL